MSKARCPATAKSFDAMWDDDGNAFTCSECGTTTPRTRDNPYPELRHKPPKKAKT